MNTISLVDRLCRKNHTRSIGQSQSDCEKFSRVGADIHSAIVSNNLPGLRVHVRFIASSPKLPEQLVAELNRQTFGTTLTFQWIAPTEREGGRLLVRNAAVGLLVSASRNVPIKALLLQLDGVASYQEVDPASALSMLSRQVARERADCGNAAPASRMLRVL